MRVLLTGCSGQLGSWISHEWDPSHGSLHGWAGLSAVTSSSRFQVNLTDESSILSALDNLQPEAILHAAAISKPDAVRLDPALGWKVNVDATARLCDWCRHHNRRLVFTSTDMVFDGLRGHYSESDPASPIVEYGRTKAAAEAHVLALPGGLVVRVSLLYGPSLNGRPTFFTDALSALKRGESRAFFADEYRSPLDYPTAAHALIRLTTSNLAGIVHLGGAQRVSRLELLTRIAQSIGLDHTLVLPGHLADAPSPEPRPADVSLKTDRLVTLFPDFSRPTIEAAARSWP